MQGRTYLRVSLRHSGLLTPLATDSCHADLADTRMAQPKDGRNYVIVLNDFLQGHPTKNLTPFLQYVLSQEASGDTLIHTAIAKCEYFMVLHQIARQLI